ncbi:Protein of unknown function [Bacillus wiedmannii]|uniref:Uncharacterized protein n=2 Tax=Bacillus cereus group TaxID=86661 RepID=A0A1C4A6P3_BACTU|nr:Protein of unknown function [Bacillus wiedmannii]SCB90374.1 Protein of unknown function [Bacillus thuringiensis]
MLLIAREGL